MTEQSTWSTFWVDSMDRPDWQARVHEVFQIEGVQEIQIDASNGEARVRFDDTQVRSLLLHSHLRAAGL